MLIKKELLRRLPDSPKGGLLRSFSPGFCIEAFRKERRIVAVSGLSRGCGVSLCCSLLASYAAVSGKFGEVAVVEIGDSYFYEALGMERRYFYREFTDFFDLLRCRKSIRGLKNKDEGINWIIKLPGEEKTELSAILRLMHSCEADTVFMDCSGIEEELLGEINAEADCCILVLDPMPTKLLDGFRRYERFVLTVPSPVVVVNKMNKGVHAGELAGFLGKKDYIRMPFISPEGLYRAEYGCVPPYCIEAVKNSVSSVLETIVSKLL